MQIYDDMICNLLTFVVCDLGIDGNAFIQFNAIQKWMGLTLHPFKVSWPDVMGFNWMNFPMRYI